MELDRHLARTMLSIHPVESARILESLDPPEAAEILSGIEAPRAAAVLRHALPVAGAGIVTALPRARALAVLPLLPIDVAAAVLRRLDPGFRDELMADLPPEEAESLLPLLTFTEGTAGMHMDPDVLALPQGVRVSEAMQRIRQQADVVRDPIFVVDAAQKLVGVISLAALLAAPQDSLVHAVMSPVEETLPATASLRVISAHSGWLNHNALPVVGENGLLLGVLDSRRLREIEEGSGAAAEQNETVEALGDLFRAGFGGLLDTVLASRPSPRPRRDPS